jgi:hypothetical protein
MRKDIFLLVFFIVVCVMTISADNTIVGTWWTEEEWDGELEKDFFTFNADGTGRWWLEDGKADDAFTYVLAQDVIAIKWVNSGKTLEYKYSLNKDGTLTLGIDFGNGYQEWIYQRVKK